MDMPVDQNSLQGPPGPTAWALSDCPEDQGHCLSAAGMLSLGHPSSPKGGCSRPEHHLSMEMVSNIHSDPLWQGSEPLLWLDPSVTVDQLQNV